MNLLYEVVAYQISSTINIRQCKTLVSLPIVFFDSDELFFSNGERKFFYVFQYGIVSFFNHTKEEINTLIAMLEPACKGVLQNIISEKIEVEIKETKPMVTFDKVVLTTFDVEAVRLVMLNTSQSVALDRYAKITESLLEETNEHTKYLERKGTLDIGGNKLKRFIGKVLNIKNQISENLYIFDAPDVTWESEKLNRLNIALKQTFDLKTRYRNIYERTEIIKENLELFKDIMDQRDSKRLEWIIIILILVEVVDLFVFRLLE